MSRSGWVASFFLSCGVEVLESRQHVLDGFYVVLAVCLMEGLLSCVHGDLRGDAAEPCPNMCSADGLSPSAFSQPSSKHCGDSCDCLEIAVVEVRRYLEGMAIGLPIFPNFRPSVGSCLHSSIDDPPVRSSRITFVETAE